MYLNIKILIFFQCKLDLNYDQLYICIPYLFIVLKIENFSFSIYHALYLIIWGKAETCPKFQTITSMMQVNLELRLLLATIFINFFFSNIIT